MAGRVSVTDEAQRRADNNRARKLAAIRRLEQLFSLICHPSFRGEISISVSAKDGYVAPHKAVTVEFEHD